MSTDKGSERELLHRLPAVTRDGAGVQVVEQRHHSPARAVETFQHNLTSCAEAASRCFDSIQLGFEQVADERLGKRCVEMLALKGGNKPPPRLPLGHKHAAPRVSSSSQKKVGAASCLHLREAQQAKLTRTLLPRCTQTRAPCTP